MGYQSQLNCTSQQFSGFDRVRTDNAQTSFFEGREFRSFYELNMPFGGGDVTFKLVTPIDFIVEDIELEMDLNGVRADLITGAVDAGPWTALSVIPANTMSAPNRRFPYYNGQITCFTGGSTAFSGGTVIDTLRVRAASQNVSAQNVNASADTARGRPPGSYFIRFAVLDGITSGNSRGVFSIRWEERPISVAGWNVNDGVK